MPPSKKPSRHGRARKPARAAKHRKPSKARPGAKPVPDHIPRFRAFLAVSLDGYIARRDGNLDWLNNLHSPEIDFAGFTRSIGITVWGRTTFDEAVARGYLQGGGKGGGRSVVLTHRPLDRTYPGVEPFSGDVRELAARLRRDLAGTGKDIWLMGGGLSIAPFHEAGLVDRWELGIMPVLLGDGVPLFPRHSRGLESLRVVESRTLKNGVLSVVYEPVR